MILSGEADGSKLRLKLVTFRLYTAKWAGGISPELQADTLICHLDWNAEEQRVARAKIPNPLIIATQG